MCKEMKETGLNSFQDVIAVTDRKRCERPFLEQIKRVCSLKPKALILREKDLKEEEYRKLAQKVSEVCEADGVMCIYHSFYRAAKDAGAENIHLPLWKFRELASKGNLSESFRIVGVSVHSAEEAAAAESLGADYLTAGHIYVTDCKKGLPARGTGFLREVCRSVHIPVYAIGGIGINEEQIEEVKRCGALGACIMSAMMRV